MNALKRAVEKMNKVTFEFESGISMSITLFLWWRDRENILARAMSIEELNSHYDSPTSNFFLMIHSKKSTQVPNTALTIFDFLIVYISVHP